MKIYCVKKASASQWNEVITGTEQVYEQESNDKQKNWFWTKSSWMCFVQWFQIVQCPCWECWIRKWSIFSTKIMLATKVKHYQQIESNLNHLMENCRKEIGK